MSLRSIITLANSIIGVSILAMPYCFKQCGILLATMMIIASGLLVKCTCHLLLKAAILARRRNYELLAFQTFGPAGKLAVEICMIGFLMGTQIAFFVVMGDLAPPIIANLTGIEPTSKLRLVILVGLGLFVALPLALLRNVESLAGLCTASIGFYLTVLLYIVLTSWGALLRGEWTSQVNFWRPPGIFQCLPIFCMALSCQPQVFEIYDALPDPSSSIMNDVVKGAVNLCSGCYICVGFFGYITFSAMDVGGNILTAYPPTFLVEMLKLGFVLSVAVSFPLVIFPCRTSIHSLIFRKGAVSSDIASNYIPPDRFNVITVLVILVTLVIGILIPDIEFVLGMVGSTIGSAICIIFPAIMFIKVTSKNTTERVAAQAIFFVGLVIMILGTYVNLYEANRGPPPDEIYRNPPQAPPMVPLQTADDLIKNPPPIDQPGLKPSNMSFKNDEVLPNNKVDSDLKVHKQADGKKEDQRREPVEPKPPEEDLQGVKEKQELPKVRGAEELEPPVEESDIAPAANAPPERKIVEKEKEIERKEVLQEIKEEQVKIKEQELEIREQKADHLIQELEKQKDEQKQILEEQKEVLREMKKHVENESGVKGDKENEDILQEPNQADVHMQIDNNEPVLHQNKIDSNVILEAQGEKLEKPVPQNIKSGFLPQHKDELPIVNSNNDLERKAPKNGFHQLPEPVVNHPDPKQVVVKSNSSNIAKPRRLDERPIVNSAREPKKAVNQETKNRVRLKRAENEPCPSCDEAVMAADNLNKVKSIGKR